MSTTLHMFVRKKEIMATSRIYIIPPEWEREERDLDKVVPQAIALFHETKEHKAKVDVLTFFCDGLLPKLSLSTLEETFLRHLFPDLPLYVDRLFDEIESIIQHESEEITPKNKSQLLHDLMEVMLTVMKCVETCVKHIHEAFQYITIHEVGALPQQVLMIVKSTISHCEKSESLYGELFRDMSQHLNLLFRKSFDLQKVLLELVCVKMEKLTISCSEKDVCSVMSVCESVLDICEITERCDGNLTPAMWKSLIWLIMKNKEVLKSYLQGDRLVTQMCSTLDEKLEKYQKLVISKDDTESNSSDESCSKLLKILKFLMKLLTSFVQSFQDVLASTFKDIIRLIYSIISASFVKSLTGQSPAPTNPDDAGFSLIVFVEPFLKILISNKLFADSLTCRNQEILSKDGFCRCYTLANIVILLPVVSEEISSYWTKPINSSENEQRISIYEALLNSCDFCKLRNEHGFTEMSLPVELPGTMCNGKPQRMVSFHEYVVSRLSASISAIPSQHFHIIEKVLLKSVFEGGMISFCIATDVWCFMARWMTAELCYSHVNLFLEWISRVSWKSEVQKNRMRSLLRRLVPLLAEKHQKLLLQEYPPDSLENLDVWSSVHVHKMISPVRVQATQKIVPLSSSLLKQWFNDNLPQFELEKILHCIQNIVSHSVLLDCLSKSVSTELVVLVTRLFDSCISSGKEISQSCWFSIIDILKSVLSLMQPRVFGQVLKNITKAVDMFKDDILSVSFARLMAECGNLSFPIGQSELSIISKIFRSLIVSKQWLVHSEAFASFSRFAEVTPYTPVLEECVPDEMKEQFKKFISGVPHGSNEVAADQNALVLNVLREQATMQQPNKICAYPEYIASENMDTFKAVDKQKPGVTVKYNYAKRTKVESHPVLKEDKETLTSKLEELSRHLIKVQEIHSRDSQLPREVWEKLKSMKTLLDGMLKST